MFSQLARLALYKLLRFRAAPATVMTEAKVQEFEALLADAIARGPGSIIAYRSAHPKYEFLSYLVERKRLLLHGTNNPGIEVFEPRRQSMANGGLTTSVFAASDGIWPIFFALYDKRHRGSIRNNCLRVTHHRGRTRKFYFFSISRPWLPGGPWTNGMIYILASDTFRPSNHADEWLSPAPVTPLAKLPVTPEDFPFTEQVGEHEAHASHFAFFGRRLLGR